MCVALYQPVVTGHEVKVRGIIVAYGWS